MFRLASLKALTSCHSRHPLKADVSGIRQLVRLRTSRSDKHKHRKFLLKIGIVGGNPSVRRMRGWGKWGNNGRTDYPALDILPVYFEARGESRKNLSGTRPKVIAFPRPIKWDRINISGLEMGGFAGVIEA